MTMNPLQTKNQLHNLLSHKLPKPKQFKDFIQNFLNLQKKLSIFITLLLLWDLLEFTYEMLEIYGFRFKVDTL